MQAYCMKCRTKREMKDAKSITMKNGRPATQGVCPVCGTKMFRIGKGYFGAGKCVLDKDGIRLSNDDSGTAYLMLGSETYGATIYKETGATGNLVLNAGDNRYTYTKKLLFPTVGGGGYLRLPVKTNTGDPTSADGYIYINDYDNALRIYADGAWRTIISW